MTQCFVIVENILNLRKRQAYENSTLQYVQMFFMFKCRAQKDLQSQEIKCNFSYHLMVEIRHVSGKSLMLLKYWIVSVRSVAQDVTVAPIK